MKALFCYSYFVSLFLCLLLTFFINEKKLLTIGQRRKPQKILVSVVLPRIRFFLFISISRCSDNRKIFLRMSAAARGRLGSNKRCDLNGIVDISRGRFHKHARRLFTAFSFSCPRRQKKPFPLIACSMLSSSGRISSGG